jgi:hypothetical protein
MLIVSFSLGQEIQNKKFNEILTNKYFEIRFLENDIEEATFFGKKLKLNPGFYNYTLEMKEAEFFTEQDGEDKYCVDPISVKTKLNQEEPFSITLMNIPNGGYILTLTYGSQDIETQNEFEWITQERYSFRLFIDKFTGDQECANAYIESFKSN